MKTPQVCAGIDTLDAELGEDILCGEPNVTDLWSVRTVEEAVGKFGYHPGDRIPRREQIKIYERVYEAFNAKKVQLVASGQYEEVVRLQETLCDLKRQFQNLQLKNVEKDQMRQSVLYRDAQKKCLSIKGRAMHSEEQRVEEVCALREAELEQLHQAQRETLELELSWLPEPRIKYTKRCLELQKAKTGLVRLHQYHDAHIVHKTLTKLLPVEEKAFLSAYSAQKIMKRRMLEKRQTHDREKLYETLTDYRLREQQERAKSTDNVKSKLEHSERSMVHAHIMALQRRPELCQNPSAHWQRRAHYNSTGASLRGEQLCQVVKGKPNGSAVKVADLTSIHHFSSIPDGSVTTFKIPASVEC